MSGGARRRKALIVLAADAETSEEELIAHCIQRIASYKCPSSVEFVEAPPRSASGKILKHELRQQYDNSGSGLHR